MQSYANLLAHGVSSGGDVAADFELFAGRRRTVRRSSSSKC
jgi:hypothetical protein